jgi:hypothetical protein
MDDGKYLIEASEIHSDTHILVLSQNHYQSQVLRNTYQEVC